MGYYDLALGSKPLVVMNSCESGNLSAQRAASFAALFLRQGARGVVATEAIIPAASATTFTPKFYARMLAGKSLGTSLLEVRQSMWKEEHDPIGLFYALYAPPALSLRQDS
jgi:hypothetical protein